MIRTPSDSSARIGFGLFIALLLSVLFPCGFAAAEATGLDTVALGTAVVALNGPWKFHIGDDVRWADTDFDDSNWESVDLTPPSGAHDSDVGLTGYVAGWQARGHLGYIGFAWYRIRVSVQSPDGATIALSGPPYVDSAYQVFSNGRLLGEFGDFSAPTPAAYAIHRPKFFPLPQSHCCVIAFRVWMGSFAARDPESGGIHIAPSLGTTVGAYARYQAQWWETIRGYVVDAAEGLIFVLLALMTLSLLPFDRSNSAYRWLAMALLFVGIARANQAVLFCLEIESIHGFEWVTVVLMVPLSLGAWTTAWYHWVRPRNSAWLPYVAAALTAILMTLEVLRRSWFYGAFPPWFESALRYCSMSVRLAFVLLTLLIIFRILSKRDREKWFTVAAVLSLSVGLFAQELSLVHIPGIWFPFGVGVSRTEYAYAVFDIAFIALLLCRLYSFRVDRRH
jgi:hypothetical protein